MLATSRDSQSPTRRTHDARLERRAFAIERLPQPIDVLPRGMGKLKSPDLERRHVEGAQTAVCGIDLGEIHERKIPAKLLETCDAFIIVQEIAATVKDETILVDLDRLGVMRGVAVNDKDAANRR